MICLFRLRTLADAKRKTSDPSTAYVSLSSAKATHACRMSSVKAIHTCWSSFPALEPTVDCAIVARLGELAEAVLHR